MTIKLFCVAMSKANAPILKALTEQAGGAVELVLHIGGTDADFKGTSLSRMTRKAGQRGHLMQGDFHAGAAMALFQSPEYGRAMMEFAAHLERRDAINDARPHRIRHVQEYVDYFHILADALARQIAESGATHALFFEIPHLGYDSIAYQLTRALGLKTLVLTQAQFDGKFVSMADLDDLGYFPSVAAPPFAIDQSERPELFYMKGVGQEKTRAGRLSLSEGARILASQLYRDPRSLLAPGHLLGLLKRARRIREGLPDWRDPFAGFFHQRDLAYFEHLLEHEDGPVDLDGDYVYFPLQYEPEMTTGALGGLYADQALAIEHLADMLPEGVRILVKENPKQMGHNRGPMFFHRLRRIPAVQFLPSHISTHVLTAKARFVACVTGTAGWEAIRQGKPALTFGRAWYRGLPGVVPYAPGLNYEQIANLTWDHAALEARCGALNARLHDGYTNRHYLKVAPETDPQENAARCAGQVLELLQGHIPPTFAPESDPAREDVEKPVSRG